MTLEEELARIMSVVSDGQSPVQFEIIGDGRTLRMSDPETGDIQAQFTVMDGANFNDMTVEQALTVVVEQLEEGIKQGLPSPGDPIIVASQIELPPK